MISQVSGEERKAKKLVWLFDQESRQKASLLRQREKRKEILRRARNVVSWASNNTLTAREQEPLPAEDGVDRARDTLESGSEMMDVSDGAHPSSPASRRKRRKKKSRTQSAADEEQLMQPEWMLQIPPHFSSEWTCVLRVEGRRCVVLSADGRTMVRLQKSAKAFKPFPSALPNGNPHNVSDSSFTVLDCIYSDTDATFYVLDAMIWKGYELYECNSEFRFYWLGSKLNDITNLDVIRPNINAFKFILLPRFPCNPQGLSLLYGYDVSKLHSRQPVSLLGPQASVAFQDGILFYHNSTHYTPGITPLVMVWRDGGCSRYYEEQVEEVRRNGYVDVVLRYCDDQHVRTEDQGHSGVSMGLIDASPDMDLYPGCCVKCRVHAPEGGAVALIEKCRFKRKIDDASKIAFLFNAAFPDQYHGPLTIDVLMHAAERRASRLSRMEGGEGMEVEGENDIEMIVEE